jgi:integrase
MAYAEKRTARGGKPYWRACFQRPDRKAQGVVIDADGKAVRYPTKTTAKKAAEKAETEAYEEAKRGRYVSPELQLEAAQTTFAQFVAEWIEGQDLAASTMQNYRRGLAQLLPVFGAYPVKDITDTLIARWEREQKANGAAASTIRTRRSLLHLLLADAVEKELAEKNVATRRRGRGRRHGRGRNRGPEKKITSMLGALLIAERTSLLSGRDDEFVASILKAYTGMRWGEIVGLEREFVRPTTRTSASSGSCTSSTPGSSRGARPRTTVTGTSICRPSCSTFSAGTRPGRRPRRVSATEALRLHRPDRVGAEAGGRDTEGSGRSLRCVHRHGVQRPQPPGRGG